MASDKVCGAHNLVSGGSFYVCTECHGDFDDMGYPVKTASVIGEAVLADAVRTDPPRRTPLPVDSSERKRTPLCTGLLDYFPSALGLLAAATPLDPNADWDHECEIL